MDGEHLPHRDELRVIERLIRRDPAGRGLIAAESEFGPLCPGHLEGAVRDLAAHATGVGIVTGFFVPDADFPAAETDGPPGALLLAAALQAMGTPAVVITDPPCAGVVEVAAEAVGFPREQLCVLPNVVGQEMREEIETWLPDGLSHLIAVERVGPNHTAESIRQQSPGDEKTLKRFLKAVPGEARDRCHNMRGSVIDEHTAPLHRCFDPKPTGCDPWACVTSIGIGDGGNEIGMGSVPWEELFRRVPGELSARIPCRIATDWTIIAGVSNWGAFGLAAGVALLRGQTDVLAPWTCEHQERMLEAIVKHGPAVDGITRRREPTVDGLPFPTYIQPWAGIRRLLGLPE